MAKRKVVEGKKRGRGRPRKYPKKPEKAPGPKRGRGRPHKLTTRERANLEDIEIEEPDFEFIDLMGPRYTVEAKTDKGEKEEKKKKKKERLPSPPPDLPDDVDLPEDLELKEEYKEEKETKARQIVRAFNEFLEILRNLTTKESLE